MAVEVLLNMDDANRIMFYEGNFTRQDMTQIKNDITNTTWFECLDDFWKLMNYQKDVLEAITGEPIPKQEVIGKTATDMPVDYTRKLAESVRLNGKPYPIAPEQINELNSRNVVRDIVYRLWCNIKGKTHPDGTIISTEQYETKEPILLKYTEPTLLTVPKVSSFKRFFYNHFGLFGDTVRAHDEAIARNDELLKKWASVSKHANISFDLINTEATADSERTLTNAEQIMEEAGMTVNERINEMPANSRERSDQLDKKSPELSGSGN